LSSEVTDFSRFPNPFILIFQAPTHLPIHLPSP